MAEISPIRRRMIEDMTVRNLSPATQQPYLNAVSKFSRYFGRSPDRLGLEDVHAFQVHLVATGMSWPALNHEVVRFLEAIPSLKSRTALTTVYAAGLRVSEVVLLKIADIDSQRMVIRVEQARVARIATSCSLRSSSGFYAPIGEGFDRRAPVGSGASSDASWAPDGVPDGGARGPCRAVR
jgi:integrase